MAFVELTKEENPKLAVQVNNSLKYQDKDGNLQDRQKVTALIDIVREASGVSGMDKGSVMLSLGTNEKGKDGKDIYKNYFVNKNKNEDIVLTPMDKALQGNKDEYIYFNKKLNTNEPDKYFYNMSKSGNAEKVVDSIKINTTEKSAYLGARVTLSNKDLLQDMIKIENDSGERHTAIIGKEKLEIVSNAELQARREAKSQEQDKFIENKDLSYSIEAVNNSKIEYSTKENFGVSVLREFYTAYNNKAPKELKEQFNKQTGLNFSEKDITLVAVVTNKEMDSDIKLELNKEYSLKELQNINDEHIKSVKKDIPVEVQDKDGKVVEKTTTPNAPEKVGTAEKKPFNKKPKSQQKEQGMER
ncbi:hypothetical protein CRU92_00745 [Arcobacter sp. FW59]|nr:hypothetical protein CRU92_00745 [Arcobacter sp. FW59]